MRDWISSFLNSSTWNNIEYCLTARERSKIDATTTGGRTRYDVSLVNARPIREVKRNFATKTRLNNGWILGKIGGNEVFLKKIRMRWKRFLSKRYNFISRCLNVDVDTIVWKNFTFFLILRYLCLKKKKKIKIFIWILFVA